MIVNVALPDGTADNRSPIILSDDEIEGLAESIFEIQEDVVSDGRGFQANPVDAQRYRLDIIAKIFPVLTSIFTEMFGVSPCDRYVDCFEQISIFAEHFAKDHIFSDGNKRTTLQISLALLDTQGIRLQVPDTDSPQENLIYRWIQDVVTGERDQEGLAEFLRNHAL